MARDRREEVLARLLVIATELEGINKAVRNKKAISEDQRPGYMINDADEEADEREVGRGRGGASANLVTMTPEQVIVLGNVPEAVGTDLNTLRRAFVKAVLTDEALHEIVGSNGEIRYKGCATGLAQGRTMEGEMGIFITFTYPFLPSEL